MRRSRHNPRTPRALTRPFVVLVRRFDPTGEELTRWEPLVRDADGRPEFFSEAKAKAAAKKPPRDADLHVGDIIAVVPAEAVSDIDNQARALFVVTPDGIKAAPKVPADLGEDFAWTAVWGQDARLMLEASASVDERRLALVACDCAETALRFVPESEARPRIAIAMTRAWCLARATLNDVRGAEADADAASIAHATEAASAAAYAANAASYAAAAATAASTTDAAYHAASSAAYAKASVTGMLNPSVYGNALREMAPLVDRWIPLPVLLLSMLGYPDAIPLNLDGVRSAQGPRSNPRGRRNHQ